MRGRIMVIGRDVAQQAVLARLLRSDGYRVELRENVAHARRTGFGGIDLAIVAAGGLGPDSGNLLRELRSSIGPVLFVADRGDAQGHVDAVDLGDAGALLARIAEMLALGRQPDAVQPTLEFAGHRLDLAGHSLVDPAGREVSLTAGEFSVLRVLVQCAGRVLSRDQLLQALAGRGADAFDRAVDMRISRLRGKIESDPKRPTLIVTVPGSGYKFTANVHEVATTALPPAPTSITVEVERPALELRQVVGLAAQLVPAAGVGLATDPEALAELLKGYRGYAAAIVKRHGGSVAEIHGRDLLAYFGHPVAEEHSAERAIRAGLVLAGRAEEGGLAMPPGQSIRVGVASGPVAADPTGTVLGEVRGEAMQLLNLAEPGQVLVAATVHRLTGELFDCRNLGLVAIRGAAGPVQAWRVLGPSGIASRSEALQAARVLPLVGREGELDLLLRCWRQATRGAGRLVLLSGEAGIGKSRLLAALEAELAAEPHVSLRYYCSPLYQDSALHPIIARWEREAGFASADPPGERLRKLETILAPARLSPDDIALIAAMLSVPTAGRYPSPDLNPHRRKEATFGALHRRLVSQARVAPVLMLFEDVHWADPTSLGAFEALVDRLADLPILLLASFRSGFAAPWVGRPDSSLIALSRLNPRQSAELASHVSAERTLGPDLLERILAQTDGVPLFIEELTKAVLEAPAPAAGATPALSVPATLQASLMARLDRLPAAKQIAQVGAVIGREFSHALLAATAGQLDVRLANNLDDLVASDLAARRGLAPDATYSFKHALVRDAAYDSLPRKRRAEIHGAIVTAAEHDTALAVEPAVLGHHCLQAGLPAKAAGYWLQAGRKAAETWAKTEAAGMFRNGIDAAGMLPHSPERSRTILELELERGDVLYAAFGYVTKEGSAAYHEAIRLSEELGDPEAPIRALDGLFGTHFNSCHYADAVGVSDRLIDIGESRDNLKALVLGLQFKGMSLFCQGKLLTALPHLERALTYEARADEVGSDFPSMAMLYLAWTRHLLGDADAALAMYCRAEALVRRQSPYRLAACLGNGCVLFAWRDDREAIARMVAELSPLAREHGFTMWARIARFFEGWAAASASGPATATHAMREAIDAFGDQEVEKSCFLGLLGHACLRTGDLARGLASVQQGLAQSERTGELYYTAELLRLRGDMEAAMGMDSAIVEASFREAIALAEQQGAKSWTRTAGASLDNLLSSRKGPGQRRRARPRAE